MRRRCASRGSHARETLADQRQCDVTHACIRPPGTGPDQLGVGTLGAPRNARLGTRSRFHDRTWRHRHWAPNRPHRTRRSPTGALPLVCAFAAFGAEETPMPNNELDDEVDPLAEEDDVVDAADEEDDEFEDDEDEDEDDEDVEEDSDIEARGRLTHEVGSEGGSPGEDMEIFRAWRQHARQRSVRDDARRRRARERSSGATRTMC